MAEQASQPQQTVKCPPCKPGLPGWMATFSDLVTLLLTFFVLLLSFAKTESAKYEAALGSIREAFGGNVLKQGEVIQPGKSPEDHPTMFESQTPVKPFPIDFLTTEGLLDKHEINRESDEDLRTMTQDLSEYNLSENVTAYQVPEGIQVRINDVILFREGSLEPDAVSAQVYDRLVQLLTNREWTVFVEGHAARGERSSDGRLDAYELSAARATAVSRSLIRRGVRADKLTTVFYGDSRPWEQTNQTFDELQRKSRRVEFLVRKTDLRTPHRSVDVRSP
jgi:chemotaxis protein MotB